MNFLLRYKIEILASFFFVFQATFVLCDQPDFSQTQLTESRNRIISINDNGVEEPELRMPLEDSIVFFFNNTKDSLISLEIDYAGKKTHCASSNFKVLENQKISSKNPVAVRDFASVCFHERGTYNYIVYGISAKLQSQRARIIVE